MQMNSPKRIPNSQKWTEERVHKLLAEIKHDALHTDAEYLGITLSKLDLYPEVWTYWKRAFKQNDDIVEEMMRIKGIYESKLVRAGLRKEVSPWVAIFALKRNYGWNENPEPEEEEEEERPTSDMYIKLADNKFIHTDGYGNGGTYRLETEEEARIDREERERKYREGFWDSKLPLKTGGNEKQETRENK
jgi:hypothetical protein